MRNFKLLDRRNRAIFGGDSTIKWNLPVQKADGTWVAGEWMPRVPGQLQACQNGYHVAWEGHLLDWMEEKAFEVNVYEAEVSSNFKHSQYKTVSDSIRLLRKMSWSRNVARSLACDAVERVIHIYEAAFPENSAPRNAVNTARAFAAGAAGIDELEAAGKCAYQAAHDATFSVPRTDKMRAASNIAYAAAQTCESSSGVILDALKGCVVALAGATASRHLSVDDFNREYFDIENRERAWQESRLLDYLDGKVPPTLHV